MKNFFVTLLVLIVLTGAGVAAAYYIKPELFDPILNKEPNEELIVSNNNTEKEDTSLDTEKPIANDSVFGSVGGKVCYPSEGIPPMTIYLQNTVTKEFIAKNNPINTGTYEFDLVPAGKYVAFAYPQSAASGSLNGGSYSPAVPCGLTVSCVDHKPVEMEIKGGTTLTGADICDFYGKEGDVPAKP